MVLGPTLGQVRQGSLHASNQRNQFCLADRRTGEALRELIGSNGTNPTMIWTKCGFGQLILK